MKLFKQLLKKYSEKVYFWSIKGEIIDQPTTRQKEKSKVFNIKYIIHNICRAYYGYDFKVDPLPLTFLFNYFQFPDLLRC